MRREGVVVEERVFVGESCNNRQKVKKIYKNL